MKASSTEEPTAEETLAAIWKIIPVSYIPHATNKHLPEMIAYHVKRSVRLCELAETAEALLTFGCGGHEAISFLEDLTEADLV